MPGAEGGRLSVRHWRAPLAVLVAGLLVTAAVCVQLWRADSAQARFRLAENVQRRQHNIAERLSAYVALLRGTAGLLSVDADLSPEEFREYVARLDLRTNYPGVQGIGFTRRLRSPEERTQVEARMRREGREGFRVWPDEPREELHSILHLEPLDARNEAALGYDMFSEPVRRAAMERARDTGSAAASGRVTLVQEIDEDKQAGFLIYVPVYEGNAIPATVAERREKLIGFAYSPFRAGDFLAGIFGEPETLQVDFAVYAGQRAESDALLFMSTPPPSRSRPWQEVTFQVAGEPWTAVYSLSSRTLAGTERLIVPLVGLGGLVTTLLLAGLTHTQRREERIRRAHAAALRESAARLQAAQDAAGVGVWELEIGSQRLFASDSAWRLIGREPVQGAAVASSVVDAIHPDDLGSGIEKAQAALRAGADTYEHEFRVPLPEATVRWLLARVRVERATGGAAARLRGAVLDITGRKRAEAQSAFLASLQETLRALEDPDALVHAATSRLGEFLGADRCAYVEVQGATGECILAGEFRHDMPALPRVLDLGAAGGSELRAVREIAREASGPNAGGASLWMPLLESERLAAAMLVQQRTPRHWSGEEVALVRTVAERCWEAVARARAARSLRATEARFRTMADSAPVLVWIADAGTGWTWCNRAWLEFTGRTLQEELGDGWRASVHPDDIAARLAALQSGFADRRPFTMEYRLRRRDGIHRWMIDHAVPVHEGPGGSFSGFIGSCVDITDRREAEEAQFRLLDAERAARLEAENVGRLKDDFLATLSHELRTPLNAILGWAHVLQRSGEVSAEHAAGLATIERNARAQAQLINDLLDMSTIVAGKLRLEIRDVDLRNVIEAAVATVLPTASAKGIRVATDLAEGARIAGDATRLQQVVWNMLHNAIKFTPREGRVDVRLRNVGQDVELVVADSGEGIPPDFLPHVFDRFRQADASTTRRHGGLGIGLSLVKQLVELHGGSVRAENAAQGGAVFTVLLPRLAVDSAAAPGTAGAGMHVL